MAELLKRGRYADEIMQILAAEQAAKLKKAFASSGRNDPCPCGSGRKFKRCHGEARNPGTTDERNVFPSTSHPRYSEIRKDS
jgi:uncharacterized protein